MGRSLDAGMTAIVAVLAEFAAISPVLVALGGAMLPSSHYP